MINLPSPHLQAASAIILILYSRKTVQISLYGETDLRALYFTEHWCRVQSEGKM